jgi:phytoene dehydrogenase-like protein
MENREYDVIIIGTGMGALTTASLLAQFADKKVLLLEQHFKPGGFTHTFRREGKFLWDVGIHYIGDMQDGSMSKKIFDIITGDKVKWNSMPEVFEKFVFPDFTFSVRNKLENYITDIVAMFPDEEEQIQKYFKDIQKVASWHGRHLIMKALPPFLDKYGSALDLLGTDTALITTGEYMKKNFKNEKLIAVLCSQWGDYGLPPSESAFAIHALVVAHYFNGGFYPIGGSGVIADAVKEIIESKGGKILISRKVKEIIIQDKKAIGVKVINIVKSKKEGNDVEELYYASKIVSNAGAFNTYTKLIPSTYPIPFREDLIKFADTFSLSTNVTLYLGLKDDPKKLGFMGENHWIYSNYDHDKNFKEGFDWTTTGEIPGAYLSFPSLKDPKAEAPTAEVIAVCRYEDFAKWKDQPWKDRDEEYIAKKKFITEKLLNYIEKHYPGFKNIVEYAELATPITTEHFTLHAKGTIYGLPCVLDRFRESKSPWFYSTTPIEDLFLTGADVASPGVSGAMMGGVAAFTQVSGGISFIKVMKEAATRK